MILYSEKWTDYRLLDCSSGERLEQWGSHVLIRPDPQVIWQTPKEHPGWQAAQARYERSPSGGGRWERLAPSNISGAAGATGAAGAHAPELPGAPEVAADPPRAPETLAALPAKWKISYGRLTFNVSLMNFKHTGLFPEQAVNWDCIGEAISSAGRKISLLNLFAYTGAATLAATAAGAEVCHVDAARGMVARARENAAASRLEDKPVRWIVDDCAKFVEREIKRGRRYDALIMDPPSYGRGPSGEVWKLEDDIYGFLKLCAGVLSDDPLFVMINSYTTGLSPSSLAYIATSLLGGDTCCYELGLPVEASGSILPCGATCIWKARE